MECSQCLWRVYFSLAVVEGLLYMKLARYLDVIQQKRVLGILVPNASDGVTSIILKVLQKVSDYRMKIWYSEKSGSFINIQAKRWFCCDVESGSRGQEHAMWFGHIRNATLYKGISDIKIINK